MSALSIRALDSWKLLYHLRYTWTPQVCEIIAETFEHSHPTGLHMLVGSRYNLIKGYWAFGWSGLTLFIWFWMLGRYHMSHGHETPDNGNLIEAPCGVLFKDYLTKHNKE